MNNSLITKIRFGPSGMHVFNRSNGLNVLFDEIKIDEEIWSKAPRQVSIALTNICDLSCSFCYAPKENLSIDFDLLKNWLLELDHHGCLSVGFGGGEPTLYPHLTEICKFIVENTKLAVTITTHGHRLDKNLANGLKDCVHFIRLSMDGIGKTYELIRKKSFMHFQRQLELAKSIAPIGINYVVNDLTIADLEEAVTFSYNVGAKEFLLLPEQATVKNSGISKAAANELQKWVIDYNGDVPLMVSELGADGLPFCNPLHDEKELHSYAHIDANGVLKRTSFDDSGYAIAENGIIETIQKYYRNNLMEKK